MKKYKKYAGANQRTPGVPQYFSWINNTNEGSTETQTLINLAFFEKLRALYGMQLRIYAWDAGNFDGASQGYGDLTGAKFLSQYPEGYKNVVEAAARQGVRFGLWGSPDGFGDDPETERRRYDFFVHLCRDYRFALFKLDGVCGTLRPEKAALFSNMLEECRRWSPDLIVLNHRLNLYEAEKRVTTFLWNGEETYTDVHTHNRITAMHSRAYLFSRGHVENLNRLAEDHGVCLSSALDYFEDELIYQAFSRSLILSPEIYGNPWFLKDTEFPKLAHVYNLQRRNAALLVNGMRLPERFGPNAVSRGDGGRRFLCTGNDTWEQKDLTFALDESVGLTEGEAYSVILRHPYEQHLGIFRRGEQVTLPLPPFRAVLAELSVPERAAPALTNCAYETIKESADGVPEETRLLDCAGGRIDLQTGYEKTFYQKGAPLHALEAPPLLLGRLEQTRLQPENGEQLFEAAVFGADNDSLEARCIKRSGPVNLPEAQAAREAFFAQKTYRLRGCEAGNMFDGDPDTFYDAQSRTYCGGFRLKGGCLRIDLGETLDADRVEITCFAADRPTAEVARQTIPTEAETSLDLAAWETAPLTGCRTEKETEIEVVKFCVHTTYMLPGRMLTAVYALPGRTRFLRVARPMDRIHAVRFFKGETEVFPTAPRANNLQAHPEAQPPLFVKTGEAVLPQYLSGSRIALAVNGNHGAEQVYCCMEIDGSLTGAPSRAPDYRANVWEHIVCTEERNNTFYFPLPDGLAGKTARFHAVFCAGKPEDTDCVLWLCAPHA